MSATAPTVVEDDMDGEMRLAPLSRGAAVFIVIVALAATVLATVDVFVNGWLAALAHIGWVLGVFGLVSLFLGVVLALLFGHRAHSADDLVDGTS
ncbi:hypothetical protein [Streptomyces javensis]|uniref:Integral membrane protein n=1 Tax=Streptomyces javensis TaxID=114698 RepID=A0ABS0R7L2_9ACTN|nr:hypothetical protein [Streptomyces javensis]MBI0312727.1 hypothetical protein [Streptomyces javensis]